MSKNVVASVFNDAIEILKLNKSAMTRVAHDKNATMWGAIILFAPFVIRFLLDFGGKMTLYGFFFKFYLIAALAVAGSLFVFTLVAEHIFHAKADPMGFLRIMAYASIVNFLSIIPSLFGFLGILNLAISVWLLVVTYNVLMHYYRLKTEHAIATILIGVVFVLLLQSAIGRMLIGRYYQMGYMM